MLKNPHGHGEGKPLSLCTHQGTHTARQKPLDTCAGKLACGLHALGTTQHFPQQCKKLFLLLKLRPGGQVYQQELTHPLPRNTQHE